MIEYFCNIECFCFIRTTKIIEILNFAPTVNCEWNEWTSENCSKTCGGGTRTKTRTKKVEEAYGGSCEGKHVFQEPCNVEDCSGTIIFCSQIISMYYITVRSEYMALIKLFILCP